MEDQKLVDVDIGFSKFKVHRQTIAIFVLGTVYLILMLGVLSYHVLKTMSPAMFAMMFGLYTLIAVGIAIYMAYVVNCMLVGKCVKLSWIIVGAYVILIAVYIGKAISLYRGDDAPTPGSIKESRSKN